MESSAIHLLDVVALTDNLPERGLLRGQVGTVVETLAPGVYEVEFADNAGRTYASLAVNETRLMSDSQSPPDAENPPDSQRPTRLRPL